MKKIFMTGLLLATCLLVPNKIFVQAQTENEINNIPLEYNDVSADNQETEKNLPLEPVYDEPIKSDYEIMPMATYVDQYENNDSFSSATSLSVKPNGKPDNYTKFIFATLHRNTILGFIPGDIDEDYYKFEVFGAAKLNVYLSDIPSGRDYDIKLYHYQNVRYSDESDIKNIEVNGNRGGNEAESFSLTVNPGMFYLKVYSHEGYSDSASYYLSIQVTYMNTVDESISNLRYNKGAKAALWISDFDPCGITPYSTNTKEEVGFEYLTTTYGFGGYPITTSDYKFENPFNWNFTSSNGIEHAALYVWGKDNRISLWNELKTIRDELYLITKGHEKIRATAESIEQIADGVLVVIGITISIFAGPKLGVISTVSSSIAGAVVKAFFPSSAWDTTPDFLLNHIEKMMAAVEANQYTSDDEVVKISSKYYYTYDYQMFINHTTHFFDFTPKYQERYLHEGNTIPAYNSNSVVLGKVYGVLDATDTQKAINRTNYLLPDVNTGGTATLQLNQGIINTLSDGEYHWYKFTAPQAGNYVFYSENDADTYGELFYNIVPARSTSGLIAENDQDGEGDNFKITRRMAVGEVIYLRVRGYKWYTIGTYNVRVEYVPYTIQTINPTNYGYEGQYFFEEKNKNITLSNGFVFSTFRLRCGYIDNEYLVLSANRKGAGTAYLEYAFVNSIKEMDIQLALWSATENITDQSADLLLQYQDAYGRWITKYDFSIAQMSKSKDLLDQFHFSFDGDGVKTFRIFVSTTNTGGDNNKGRVVIGNINLSY